MYYNSDSPDIIFCGRLGLNRPLTNYYNGDDNDDDGNDDCHHHCYCCYYFCVCSHSKSSLSTLFEITEAVFFLPAGRHREQFWLEQGCQLFDVVHSSFPLPTMALPTLQGALTGGFEAALCRGAWQARTAWASVSVIIIFRQFTGNLTLTYFCRGVAYGTRIRVVYVVGCWGRSKLFWGHCPSPKSLGHRASRPKWPDCHHYHYEHPSSLLPLSCTDYDLTIIIIIRNILLLYCHCLVLIMTWLSSLSLGTSFFFTATVLYWLCTHTQKCFLSVLPWNTKSIYLVCGTWTADRSCWGSR